MEAEDEGERQRRKTHPEQRHKGLGHPSRRKHVSRQKQGSPPARTQHKSDASEGSDHGAGRQAEQGCLLRAYRADGDGGQVVDVRQHVGDDGGDDGAHKGVGVGRKLLDDLLGDQGDCTGARQGGRKAKEERATAGQVWLSATAGVIRQTANESHSWASMAEYHCRGDTADCQ